MELDDIIQELDQHRGPFPRASVDEAIRRREEISPHLLRALEEAAERTEAPEEEDVPFLLLYAMFLLAQFRDRRAYPLMIRLCKLPAGVLDSLIGETITEGLPRILASVFDGDTAPIASVIEDPSLDEYIRASALRSLSILVHEEVLSRGTVIEYFAELFRGKLEKEHSHLWDALAAEAVDLHAKTLADDIQGGFETGLLWPGFMHPQEIDKAFSQSEDAVLARSREHSPGLIDSVVDEMRWWACFKPQTTPGKTSGWRETRLPAGKHNPGAAVRAEPKVGRNAPCPCGSGKKYKKCCGVH